MAPRRRFSDHLRRLRSRNLQLITALDGSLERAATGSRLREGPCSSCQVWPAALERYGAGLESDPPPGGLQERIAQLKGPGAPPWPGSRAA